MKKKQKILADANRERIWSERSEKWRLEKEELSKDIFEFAKKDEDCKQAYEKCVNKFLKSFNYDKLKDYLREYSWLCTVLYSRRNKLDVYSFNAPAIFTAQKMLEDDFKNKEIYGRSK